MRTNIRNTITVLLLVALAVGTWVLSRPQDPAVASAQGDAQLEPGYYLKDAVIHGTDDQGRIYYRVFAETVEQSTRTDDLVLKAMRVEYEPRMEIYWTLSADEAIKPSSGSQLTLSRGVRLTSTGDGSMGRTTIETDELLLDVESSDVNTDAQVFLSQGETLLEATGLRANLRQNFLELQSNVRMRTTP